jgi:hypothetical protein
MSVYNWKLETTRNVGVLVRINHDYQRVNITRYRATDEPIEN